MALRKRTLLLPLLLLASSALAGQATVVSSDGRALSDAALRGGIARCQRDASDLPISDCIERYEVPLWRLGLEAGQRFESNTPLRQEIENRVLAERLTELLLEQAELEEADVPSYLAANRTAWATPERIRIFRILVATREQAQALIGELGRGTPADFRAAARTRSLDRTSHERGGDLGFVAADGTTDLPGVEADPALFGAAHGVPDGAFVPEPVSEGSNYAVVWRRGSLAARQLPEAEARSWAGGRVREGKARRELDQLLAAHPADRHTDLLARFRRPECKIFAP